MKFRNIPQFPQARYNVTVTLDMLKTMLWEHWDIPGSPLILCPEWQRGHVWTEGQQIAFLEYILRGGTTGRDIYFNCSSWNQKFNTPIYCLDGLQRITAVQAFLDNKIRVFNHLFSEFEDPRRLRDWHFTFHMLNISSKKELLKIYFDFNSGGSPHDPAELQRIALMIEQTNDDETL